MNRETSVISFPHVQPAEMNATNSKSNNANSFPKSKKTHFRKARFVDEAENSRFTSNPLHYIALMDSHKDAEVHTTKKTEDRDKEISQPGRVKAEKHPRQHYRQGMTTFEYAILQILAQRRVKLYHVL